jgi:hypothetical protein
MADDPEEFALTEQECAIAAAARTDALKAERPLARPT